MWHVMRSDRNMWINKYEYNNEFVNWIWTLIFLTLCAIPDVVVEPECNTIVVVLCSIAQPRAVKY